MEIKCELDPVDVKRIPKEGPFIVVANHPFGITDGIILMKTFKSIRPDFLLMANEFLQRLEPINDFFIPVNPLETAEENSKSSFSGIRFALQHLSEGRCLGIYPAGEVSSYQRHTKSIEDREWQLPALKLIKKARVPIVPVYFDGSSSSFFHLTGMIHPLFKAAGIPSETLKKRKTEVKMRIGNPISVADQDLFETIHLFGRFLRVRTYALGSALEVKKFFKKGKPSAAKPVVAPVPDDLIIKEVESLGERNFLARQQNFDIYIAEAKEIPNILNEIGRLREITFREVGEGTNNEIDLDEYDLYYHHLFIWDTSDKKIVGAYRVGKGDEIIEKYGKKGFYTHSLFKIKDKMLPYLQVSIELGRSFITREYQLKRLPLFLLWKGILYFLLKNPHYRYMVGPVSISNRFSEVSRGLIVEFVKANFFDENLAQYVKPRKKFKPDFKNLDTQTLLSAYKQDFNKLSKLISEIEPEHFDIPVLLKKYIHLNARIIAFNVDPNFSNALDGFIMLDIQKVPEDVILNLKKELE
jgi:putative hemolysin